MRIFRDFDNLSSIERPFVTIGSFDGVHMGHREILSQLCQMAKENQAQSVVITFSSHPRNVLSSDHSDKVKLINTLDEKIELLEQVGIDNLIIVPFTEKFSQTSYQDFVSSFLVDKLHIYTLMVGYNHHFGHKKEGDSKSLMAMSRKLDFSICEMAPRKVGEQKVSSTIIREKIALGNLSNAAKLLGYRYFITATIDTSGNVDLSEANKVLPPQGEYDVSVPSHSQTPCKLIINSTKEMKLSPNNIFNVKNRSIVRIFFAE